MNLSFFTNGMGSFINASFVENLEINVEVNTKDNLFTLAGTGAVAVDVANTEMLLYNLNMEEANLRKLEDQAYSLERPLSMAQSSFYQESAVTVSGTNGTQASVTLNMNCPNIMTKSIIYIDKFKKSNGDVETGMIGEFVKIDKIVWSMAGREVYEYSSSDEYRFENALFLMELMG